MKKLWTSRSLLVLLIIAIVFGLIIYLLPSDEKTLLNIVTIITSGITLLGLIITLGQIVEVGSIAIQTEKEVKNKLERFNHTLFFSELSTVHAMISEVSSYLRSGKYELSKMRINDIKTVIIKVNASGQTYGFEINKKTLSGILTDLSIDLSSLEKIINNPKNTVNVPAMISNLEKAGDALNKIKLQIHII